MQMDNPALQNRWGEYSSEPSVMVKQVPLDWIFFNIVPEYAVIEPGFVIKEHLYEIQIQEKSLIWEE